MTKTEIEDGKELSLGNFTRKSCKNNFFLIELLRWKKI